MQKLLFYFGLRRMTPGPPEMSSCPPICGIGRNSEETMARCYQGPRMMLYPTLAEPIGLVVAEAMACRLPVIASRVGAMPELIDDGVSGILVTTGDVRACAEAVKSLADRPEARRRPGWTASGRVRKEFTKSRMIDQYEALYSAASIFAEKQGRTQ